MLRYTVEYTCELYCKIPECTIIMSGVVSCCRREHTNQPRQENTSLAYNKTNIYLYG